MTAEQLKKIFEQAYKQTIWIDVLREVFGLKNVLIKPQEIDTPDNKWQAKGFELGNFETVEGRLIGVYEVQINKSVKLHQNKVGLRNLLKPIYSNDVDAALVVFNQGEQWRFSYVSEIRVRNKQTGKREKKSTDPKRYTYLFGTGQKCRTAAERFAKIQQQTSLFGAGVKLDEIERAFSVDSLTKDFYRELSDWYLRALKEVEYPDDAQRAENPNPTNEDLKKEKETRNATNTIRLITRLIFVWFLKQKGLVPDDLFDKEKVDQLINYKDKTNSTYYKAILQNLFFATLNTEMGDANRKFIDRQYGVQGYYRYKRYFKDADLFLELTKNIPFLNGGLFENLDKNVGEANEIRIDCFSNATKNEAKLTIPDSLFFETVAVDLSAEYDDKKKNKQTVRGLIDILQSYNFTIEENTPFEIEVALDPELLGKVFENLLASYNPETQTTARKMTGSFYTPREIVDYMVDESLKAYIKTNTSITNDEQLNKIFAYNTSTVELTKKEKLEIIQALDKTKILDPACGSGAYPMGILHKMVFLLNRLDENNEQWKAIQRQRAIHDTEEAFKLGNKEEREERLKDINDAFEDNSDDYGRKLFLIENCIYGVDIQPIAVQIAKLRFFISLICDQEVNKQKKNYGIRPLPNLETKFVAANTLMGLTKPKQLLLRNPKIEELEAELNEVRHRHFSAKTPATKRKYRIKDAELRNHISELLLYDGWDNTTAKQIANWNPYDQNITASFFDNEWMFGLIDGFDIVIGNPPYVFAREARFSSQFKEQIKTTYLNKLGAKENKSLANQSGKINLFSIFIIKGLWLLKENGIVSYILPNNILRTTTYDAVRKYILNNSLIKEVVDLGSGVFDNVTASTVLFSLQNASFKTKPEHNVKVISKVNNIQELDFIKSSIRQSNFLTNTSYTINLFIDESFDKINQRFKTVQNRLGEYCKYISPGIDGDKEKFVADRKINSKYKPLLFGKDFGRYKINFKEHYILYDRELLNRAREQEIFLSEKIILQRISGGSKPLTATIDTEQYYTFNSVNNIVLNDKRISLKVFLAMLNSELLNWYYAKNFSNDSNLTVNISKTFLEQLPIVYPYNDVAKFEHIVSYILLQKSITDNSSFFERLIDAMVYELYLPEEIKAGGAEVLKYLSNLPELTNGQDEKNLKTIEKVYKELSDPKHPISGALLKLLTIEEINIIEGRK